ncbi:hypothetical protein [Amycolatopsis sp. lyj-90]|uniref:WXG100-like domain-containing protein n=1 Tax=Amycolatopsis sp. lyj-90 TaxID=2789285 RepID=UPI0039783940
MSGEGGNVQLPDALQKFFLVVLGAEWPEASESGLRALAWGWTEFAAELEELGEALLSSSATLDAGMDGALSAAVVEVLRKGLAGGVVGVADNSRELAKAAKTAALDVQKSKALLVVMGLLALATVLELLYSLIFAFLIPAVTAAAQVTMRVIIRQLLAKLQQITLRQAGTAVKHLAMHTAKFAALGAGLMGGLDLVIQAGQVAFSGRDEIDWSSVGNSVLGGAAGGAVAGFAHGMALGVRSLSRTALPSSKTFTGRVIALGEGLHAGLQVLVTPIGTLFGNLVTQGKGGAFDGVLGAAGASGTRKAGIPAPDGRTPNSVAVVVPEITFGHLLPPVIEASVGSPAKPSSGQQEPGGRASSVLPPVVPAERRELLAREAEAAANRLGKLGQARYDALISEAAFIVSRNHRTPLLIWERPNATVRDWQGVIADVRVVVAAEVHRAGTVAGREVSAQLAKTLGTERVGGLVGAGPGSHAPQTPATISTGPGEAEAGPSSAESPAALPTVESAGPEPAPRVEGVEATAAAVAFLQPDVELRPLDRAIPEQTSPATEQIRRLATANSVLAASVNGVAIRADVRGLLETAGAPPAQIARVLDALPDLALKDNFKKFAHEGYVVTDGHGADAVEIVVRGTAGDNTSADTTSSTGPQDPARGTDTVAMGGYGSTSTDAVSAPRRQGAFGHNLSLPVSEDPQTFRTVDQAVGIKGVTSQPSWRTSSTIETQASASVTPPDIWTESAFDLNHQISLNRTGEPTQTRQGNQAGGVRLSTPEILTALRPAEFTGSRPDGPRATFLRGDRELPAVVGGVLDRHPAWAGAADVIGSPLRATLLDITGSDALSRTGTELAGGAAVVKKVELKDSKGGVKTATVELRASMSNHRHYSAGPRPGGEVTDEPTGTVSRQGRGHRGEESAGRASRSPFDVNASIGLGFLWSIHNRPSVVFGDRLDARADGMVFRSAAETRDVAETDEITATTAWSKTGRLRLRTSDVTYDFRARFDDGSEYSGSHFVADGATRWSVESVEKPTTSREPDLTAAFAQEKVLGAAETRFQHAGRLRTALRARLPEGVLRQPGRPDGTAATADNEALVSTLLSSEGLTALSADLNGDGLSFLLVERTHRLTNRSGELLHVLVETVPAAPSRRFPVEDDFSETGPSGELASKQEQKHTDTVEGSVTAGANMGVRIGAGAGRTVRSYELTGGSNRSFANVVRTVETTETQQRGQGWSSEGGTARRRAIDYRVTLAGGDGTKTFLVAGGRAETLLGGRITLTPPPVDGNTAFTVVSGPTLTPPRDWSPAALPDHSAVHGLDLPPGIARYFAEHLFGGLGEGARLAEHQLYRFAGPDRVAANLDRAVTGTYFSPLHRYGRGEGDFVGFRDRVGEAAMAIALSNATVAGPPRKVTLTFTSATGGTRGHGGRTTSGGYTFGNIRSGIAAGVGSSAYAFPQGGYGRFASSSEGRMSRFEHEQSRRTTYTGDAYLVTYDAMILLAAREHRHLGIGPYDGTEHTGWRYAHAHRRNAVQVWVPADEIGGVGLPAGWDRAFRAEPLPASGDLPSSYTYDGRAPISIDFEATGKLLDAVDTGLTGLRTPPATTSLWSALASRLGAAAHQVVFGAGDEVAATRLLDRVRADLPPRTLEQLYPELSGAGKTWSESFTGPLGTIGYELTLTARTGEGTSPRPVSGWSDQVTAKTIKTEEATHEETTSHSLNFAFRMPFYLPHPVVRGLGFSGQSGLSGSTTLGRTETVTTQESRTASSSGDAAIFRHDVTFGLEFRRTAHLGRSLRSLTGGLSDLVTPAATRHRAPDLLLPDSVRSRVGLDTLSPGEEQRHIGGLPTTAHLEVPNGAVGSTVGEILDGVPVAEDSGPPPPGIPEQAAAARRTVALGTSPGALAAGLPDALTATGYRVEGLGDDPYFAAGFFQQQPLSTLVFHADLAQTWVTALTGGEGKEPEVTVTGDVSMRTRQDLTTGPSWSTAFLSFPLSLFPRRAAPATGQNLAHGLVPGTSLVELPEARGVGPMLSWQNSASTESGGKTAEHSHRSRGELYQVRVRVDWRITPEYRGSVPPGWTRTRTATDVLYFRTDADGLDSLGLRPPEPEDVFYDARSHFGPSEPDSGSLT